MADLRLTAVSRTQGNNAALKRGDVAPTGVSLAFEEVPVLPQAFRRMVRGLEFDVSEMALTTYLVAKAHGVALTALPVFLVRGFHHGAIQTDPAAGFAPADLAGRKVGVNRGYTVTTGVWARGVLQDEHDVDLDSVTWVLSGDEHVQAYRPPANVEAAPAGASLADLLADGELAAVVGADLDGPGVAPLLPDAEAAGYEALRSRGHYPINHLVVVRDELLAEHPDLGERLFEAFAASKALYVEQLRAGGIAEPTAADRLHATVMELTGSDPLPYGIEPNRVVLEELMRHAVDQSILAHDVELDQLFAPGTRDLTA
jgi:4,5-dihydroxyphthalate decarboxylase